MALCISLPMMCFLSQEVIVLPIKSQVQAQADAISKATYLLLQKFPLRFLIFLDVAFFRKTALRSLI